MKMTKIEKIKLLAEYLEYQYIPSNDLQDYSRAGWYKPLSYSSPYMEMFQKKSPDYYLGRTHYDLGFHNSYDTLFKVIEKLEKEDLSEYMYKWEDIEEGSKYNFIGIDVERFKGKWDVDINLELDPPINFYEKGENDVDQLFNSLCAAVEYINVIKSG